MYSLIFFFFFFLVALFQLSRTMQLSLSRVASAAWTAAGWNGSGGRIALCRSCARTLRRSLTVQVCIFISGSNSIQIDIACIKLFK